MPYIRETEKASHPAARVAKHFKALLCEFGAGGGVEHRERNAARMYNERNIQQQTLNRDKIAPHNLKVARPEKIIKKNEQ